MLVTFCKDETWNSGTKLDDSLTEGIGMMWNVAVELLFIDRTTLSLDDDHLRLRSKICAVLCLMRKHDTFKGHVLDHHGIGSVVTNCIATGQIESSGEGIKKSLEKIIRFLNTILIKPDGDTVNPFHLNRSSDRAFNGSDDTCHNKIEWVSTAGGKATRALGFDLSNELDKASQ